MPDLLLISLFIVTVILALVCLVLWAKVARLSERGSRIPELETQAERLKDDLRAAQANIVVLNSWLSETEARREAERKASDQKVALLTGAREEFGVQFENLANRIFDDKSRKFTEQNKLN